MKDLTHLRHCSLLNFIKIEIHLKSLKKDPWALPGTLRLVCLFVSCFVFLSPMLLRGTGEGEELLSWLIKSTLLFLKTMAWSKEPRLCDHLLSLRGGDQSSGYLLIKYVEIASGARTKHSAQSKLLCEFLTNSIFTSKSLETNASGCRSAS